MQGIRSMLSRSVGLSVVAVALGLLGAAGTAAAAPTQAKLSLTKTAPASATAGSPFNYTITVANNGPSDSTNTTVVDPLPANTTAFGASASQGSCTTNGSQQVTCSVGTLASGSSATITITVSVSQAGSVTNTASASNSEGSTAKASATTKVNPAPPPSGTVPTATTGPATGISNTNATLTGQVVAGNQATHYFFEWGTTPGLGRNTAISGPVTTTQNVTAALAGLTPGTVYYYRLVAINDSGTAYGQGKAFKTTGTSFLGSLVLDGTRLTVSHGDVRVKFTCRSSKSCFGLFSITTRLRLAKTHQLATIVCTVSRDAKYRIGAHGTKLVAVPLHKSCLTALARHHGRLSGKLTTRPRTAQRGVVKFVTMFLR